MRRLGGVALLGLFAAGCTADDSAQPQPGGLDASIPLVDGSTPRIDGSVSADAAHDAGVDTSLPDTSLPDTNAPDTNAPDTNAPDTSAPDAEITDAGIDAIDAAVPFDGGPCALPDGGVAVTCDEVLVDVTNPGSALASYTLPFVVDTRPLVAAGKVKPDCSDLAPFAADHATPLPFWVATGECNTAATRIFVQLASLAAGGTTRIYLTYGASPAVTQTPAALFTFFDDFTGAALDTGKWTHFGNGTYSIVGGQLTTQYANLLQTAASVVTSGTTVIGVREDGNSAVGDDFEIGVGTVASVSSASNLWIQSRTGQWVSLLSWAGLNVSVSAGQTFCSNDGVAGSALFDGKWNDYEMRYDLTSGSVTAQWTRSEDGWTGTHPSFSDAGCLPAASGPILLGLDHDTGSGANPISHIEWVYARAGASPEPSVTVTLPAWTSADASTDASTD